METTDLIRAIPGLVAAALLPGFLLATLIAPRWPAWERAVVAPGLSAGLVGVVGLALRLAHIPFIAATVLPVVAVIGVASIFRWRKAYEQRAPGVPAQPRAAVRGVVAAGLLAGAVSAGVLAYSLHTYPLPPDWDPPEHGSLVNAIVRTHDVYAPLPIPLEHISYVHPRIAFEATAALVSSVRGPSPAASMMPVVLVAVALMPLGLAMLALETTESYWVAALTPLLSAGMAFPSFQVILGRFPLVMDATLVAAAVVAMARLVRGRDVFSNAAMVTAITTAIWVTHGLEALTALVIGGPLIIELLLRLRSLGAVMRAGAGVAAAGAGAALTTVLSRVPHIAATGAAEFANSAKSIGLGGSAGPRIHPHLIIEYLAQTDLSSPVALGLLAIGVVAVLATRRLLWALAALLLVFAALADVIYPEHLKSFWLNVVWPWGDVDRLLGVPYWVVPLLMAFGVVWAARLALQASRHPSVWGAATIGAVGALVVATVAGHRIGHQWKSLFRDNISLFPFGQFTRLNQLVPWVAAMALAASLVAIGWVTLRLVPQTPPGRTGWRALNAPGSVAMITTVAIGLLSLGIGAQQEQHIYQNNIYYRQLAIDADVTVMDEMSRRLPPGSRVMTDEVWDAGMWVAAVTNDTLLVPKSTAGGELSRPIVLALDNACNDKPAVERALTSFDAIFVGAHHMPGTPDVWDPKCIAAVPGLREIAHASSGGSEAHAFAVTRLAT